VGYIQQQEAKKRPQVEPAIKTTIPVYRPLGAIALNRRFDELDERNRLIGRRSRK